MTNPENNSTGIGAKILDLASQRHKGLSKEQIEAGRVLAVQSRSSGDPLPTPQDWEDMAHPDNRAKALLAYDKAITSLMRPRHGGMSDVRGQVYDAARVLGLDTSSAAIAAARHNHHPGAVEAAQRLLADLPDSKRTSVVQILSDKQVAASVYRDALQHAEDKGTAAGDMSSTSALRSRIHGDAAILGLGTDALYG